MSAPTTDAEIANQTTEQRAALAIQLQFQAWIARKSELIACGYTEAEADTEIAAHPVVTPPVAVTGLSQSSANVGSGDIVLSVYGSGFTEATVILFDGVEQTTTFVDDGEVTCVVAPSTADPETVVVSVVGAASAAFEFTTAVPTVTGLSVASAVVGDEDFTLSVYGTGFSAATVILFDAVEKTTTFVDEGEVTMVVALATAETPEVVPVSVVGAAQSVDFEFTAAE